MSRQSGYIVTAKFFVPSPKNDFAKQAAAATMMATVTTTKTMPADFLALAKLTDISAKYGSQDVPDDITEPAPAK